MLRSWNIDYVLRRRANGAVGVWFESRTAQIQLYFRFPRALFVFCNYNNIVLQTLLSSTFSDANECTQTEKTKGGRWKEERKEKKRKEKKRKEKKVRRTVYWFLELTVAFFLSFFFFLCVCVFRFLVCQEIAGIWYHMISINFSHCSRTMLIGFPCAKHSIPN